MLDRVSRSGTMKYQFEWKYRCVKLEMVTYITKRRPFLFSKVVQRYSGDKVIRWLVSLTKLIIQFRRTTRNWSHCCISPLTGIAPIRARAFVSHSWRTDLAALGRYQFPSSPPTQSTTLLQQVHTQCLSSVAWHCDWHKCHLVLLINIFPPPQL